MNRQAEDIFNDALELTGVDRQRFLTQICAGDPDLLREVMSLLDAYEEGDETLLPAQPPRVPERIGGYPIVAEVARGGMGVVYLAEDEGLHRRVALKVLPPWLARDPAGLERFHREGRTLASLDHPNIATVHSLEEVDGTHFLTMEWVDGETLAEHIRGKRLPTGRAAAICLQIARALRAAHARGVVHRDLKPLNAMVKPDGQVKVLDFGLAKVFGEPCSGASAEVGTTSGASLAAGTPGYMAPEQVQGGSADQRADVWAFGCILYEVFTGEPLFPDASHDAGGSDPPTPSLEPLRKVASAPIVELAERALAPDRDTRLLDMDGACRVLESECSAARPGRWWYGRALVAAAVGIVGLVVALAMHGGWGSRPGPTGAGDVPLDRADQVQLTHTGTAGKAEISPDGNTLAWLDGGNVRSLCVRTLPNGAPRQLHRFWTVTELRWSPDNETLLVAGQSDGASSMSILLLRVADGMVLDEFDFDRHLAWAPDGSRFASAEPDGNLRITDVHTRESEILLEAPPWHHVNALEWSPTGRWLVVSGQGGSERLWIVALDDRRATPVELDGLFWSPRCSDDGTALLLIDDRQNVWQLQVDPQTGLPVGAPEHVLALSGLSSPEISCSASGRRIAYTRGPGRANIWLLDLETHTTTQLTRGTLDHHRTRLSPDGRSILFTRRVAEGGGDVFLVPVTGGEPVRLTSFQSCTYAAWSADGRRIAFTRRDESNVTVCIAESDGSAMQEFQAASTSGAIAWAPGRSIAFTAPGNHAIRELDVDTGSVREIYDGGADAFVWQPQWSPDGRRFAVLETSIRGPDHPRVLVVDSQTRTRTVAHVGLATPLGWSGDGKYLHLVTRRRASENESARASTGSPSLAKVDSPPSLALLKVPAGGGVADTLGIVPHLVGLWSSLDIDLEGRHVVYTAADFLADIWLVERTGR